MRFRMLNEEIVYRGRVFDLVRAHFQMPNGKEPTFDLVKHHGAVVIVPVDTEGNIWFVKQFRIGAGKELLELPAGVLEEGEAPETSAVREIREEIGMAANRLKKLGEFYMVPGYSTEKLHAYLATDLYPAALPADDDELLERVAIPIQQVFEMAEAGQIEDGKTIASLLLARQALAQLGSD